MIKLQELQLKILLEPIFCITPHELQVFEV